MRKTVKWIIIILCVLLVIVGISHLFRRHESRVYGQPYAATQSYGGYHGDSLAQTAVKSAVRGASTYAGYHIAKSIHNKIKQHNANKVYSTPSSVTNSSGRVTHMATGSNSWHSGSYNSSYKPSFRSSSSHRR